MKSLVAILLFFILFGSAHIYSLDRAAEIHRIDSPPVASSTVLSGPIAKILALEFDGVAADLLFLKAMIFIGETQDRDDVPRIKYSELIWFSELLKAASDLDPYFYDLYYFGTAHLTWNEYTGKSRFPTWEEYLSTKDKFLFFDFLGHDNGSSMANTGNLLLRDDYLLLQNIDLLDKGSFYRPWDSTLPYYNGFIHFYFFDENEKASEYLMEASRLQENSSSLASLAARLAYEGNKTENAVVFLSQILEVTTDENLKEMYSVRLEALRGILFLENGIAAFKKKMGRMPSSLQDLVTYDVISSLPKDPYGGKFYLEKNGEIKTSSNLVH